MSILLFSEVDEAQSINIDAAYFNFLKKAEKLSEAIVLLKTGKQIRYVEAKRDIDSLIKELEALKQLIA